MARRRRQQTAELNVWPAYVDVLATLLLVIILLVLAVTLTQFYTADRASQAEQIGDRLTQRLIEQRAQLDALESARQSLLGQIDLQLEQLNVLSTDRDTALDTVEDLLAKLAQADGQPIDLESSLTDALLQVDDKLVRLLIILDNLEAERDLLTLENQDLNASLTDLGAQINDSLLQEAEELQRQRSLFFGSLIEVLGDREDISVVGDRFVFQSEVLFDTASATLGTGGRQQLAQLAQTILALAEDFPDDLDWILRIDGHTDARPIGLNSRSGFTNNWQLSSARAGSVVAFLIDQGVPPERLAAAGFGEHQPLVAEDTPAAYARNRRIEVKLTTR